jgi:hypothetical protein
MSKQSPPAEQCDPSVRAAEKQAARDKLEQDIKDGVLSPEHARQQTEFFYSLKGHMRINLPGAKKLV